VRPSYARSAIAGLVAAVALLAAPAAAQAACGAVERFQPPDPTRDPPPLAIGDSVMAGAVKPVLRAGFEVDVRTCRHMSEALRVLSSRRSEKSLPDVVVVALGNNSTISAAQIRRALRIVGRKRVLGMVTPRGRIRSARAAIRAAGRRWPERLKVLDWAARSAGKPWTSDGLHLTPAGARAFARLLRKAYRWVTPVQEPSEDGGGGVVAP
jgi:lysophospholipase L1-like esterase